MYSKTSPASSRRVGHESRCTSSFLSVAKKLSSMGTCDSALQLLDGARVKLQQQPCVPELQREFLREPRPVVRRREPVRELGDQAVVGGRGELDQQVEREVVD